MVRSMQVNVKLDNWMDGGDIGSNSDGLVFQDLEEYRRRAGVYLIETSYNGSVEHWYVGQAGNLEERMGDYRQASGSRNTAREESTETRVASELMRALGRGRKARVRFLRRAEIQIPARLFAENDDPLTWMTNLDDTTVRVLVESAAVLHQTMSMAGPWEVRINRGGIRKSTDPSPSPLEDIFEGSLRCGP
jgi:hypothetical protein